MNIFVTSNCPIESARYLDDKRVVKMILESAQLLSSAIHLNGGVGPYKITHTGHPCTKWVAASLGNYNWVLNHFTALCTEYTRRFGKIHKCQSLTQVFITGALVLPIAPLQPFVNCTKYPELPVLAAYRQCLTDKFIADKRPATCKVAV